jgi:uncharacterized membrane-anchored protein
VRLNRPPAPTASKVPEITMVFWLIKLLTTGLGEATSDSLVHRLGGPEAVVLGFVVFCLAMLLQFSLPRYTVLGYWLAVAMVGVFGTMGADVMHVALGIAYAVSASFYLIVLAAVFALWHRTEHTLSIHSIITTRRECFYWAAVFATFALGTATGDLCATTLHLGYAGSAVLFAVLFVVPGLTYFAWRRHDVFFFWAGYVLTRPLGASVADWLGMPKSHGGLGYGAGTVALVSWAIFLVAIAALALRSHSRRPGGSTPR